MWPTLFRKVDPLPYRRERIETADGDFLDLDWLEGSQDRLVIISHGLEGDSTQHYVVGMAQAVLAKQWDVLAWNFRGNGGEINRQPRFTHSGSTDDLAAVIEHAVNQQRYESIVLVGFSMGGNITLTCLGREADRVPAELKASVCFSVPCDLEATAHRLAERSNAVYMKRFMKAMGRKVRRYAESFPEKFPFSDYHTLRTFADFDGRYTAPLHGFESASHYWQVASCGQYLKSIEVPTWIVNARNDPFLAPSCFPATSDLRNPNVQLIVPRYGGHCGFATAGKKPYWSESVVVRILDTI